MILTCLTMLDLLHHVGLLSFRRVRFTILKRKLQTAPAFKVTQRYIINQSDNIASPGIQVRYMDIDLSLVCSSLSYGDWKLCYHLIRNMDSLTCAEWLQALTKRLRFAFYSLIDF